MVASAGGRSGKKGRREKSHAAANLLLLPSKISDCDIEGGDGRRQGGGVQGIRAAYHLCGAPAGCSFACVHLLEVLVETFLRVYDGWW